nr:MAG TPA_asm: hypothetical protein [Caudoviricetes sp.]
MRYITCPYNSKFNFPHNNYHPLCFILIVSSIYLLHT